MRDGAHQAIRDTWGKDLPPGVDVRFFFGDPPIPAYEDDEVQLPVDDGYWELTQKMRAICDYVLRRHYDFVYPCDTDTYLIPEKMLKSGFEDYDFSGSRVCGGDFGKPYPPYEDDRGGVVAPFYTYLSGGVGFFMSQKAAYHVASTSYYHFSEDVWVGQVLGPLIENGFLRAGKLEEGFAEHLCCGFYGGGHKVRKSPAEAICERHAQ